MNKTEFLSELQYSLEGKLPIDEINEIIADYSDIFNSGISEGKSEESTSSELGSPAKISRRILEDAPTYTGEKHNRFSTNRKNLYTGNLASLLKRFGAYIVDNLIGSLVLAAIIALILLPFSTHEMVTHTEGEYRTTATPKADKGAYNAGSRGYTAKLYQDKNGLMTKAEVWDMSGKRLFKGNNEEFVTFLDNNNIHYPEEFKSRIYVTTIDTSPQNVFVLIMFLPYMLFFLFLGVGNIFNVIIVWRFKGYTIGKKLFNIKLEKADGEKLAFTDVLLREFVVKIIGNIITGGLLNVGSFIWACITGENKTVHDLAAKTRVIEVKQ